MYISLVGAIFIRKGGLCLFFGENSHIFRTNVNLRTL